VDDRPVIWDRANLAEVEEAMTDSRREEVPDPKRTGYWLVRGRTAAGRRLFVAWVEHRIGRYPVHVHVTGRHGR